MSLKDFINQASAETRVKYGPELSALQQLLTSAEGDYSASRSAAAGSAAGIQQAVKQAVPFVTAAYDQAGKLGANASTLLSHDLAGLGPTADPYKAAATTESAAALSKLGTARAAAVGDLGSRYARAQDTANYMRSKALGDLQSTKGQIGNRLTSLAQEEGSFAQGRVAGLSNDASKLRAEAAKLKAQETFQAGQNAAGRAVTKRGQDLSHTDRVAAAAKRAATAKGPKWAPGKQQGDAQSKVGSALNFANQFKQTGMSRHQAAQYLLSGQKGQPVYDTVKTNTGTKQVRKLNPDGTPVVGRSVPSFDPVLASVALDVAYDGHISRYNVGRLHARGIKINALGYPTKPPPGSTSTYANPPRRATTGSRGDSPRP